MPDPCPGPPPPCIPPCLPPPPPGGDGCLRMKWTCGCPLAPFAGPPGNDQWNPAPGFPQCVVDPLCSTYSCSPLEFWVDFPNGCLAGVPLFVPPTPNPVTGAPYIPGCVPSCCGDDPGCFRYRWECECPSSDPIWVLKAVECVANSACTGASEWTTKTPQTYADEVLDGCTLTPLWMPAAPVPPIAPDCCPGAGECEYLYTATCADGVWTVDAGALQGCSSTCTPTGWEPAGACARTQVVCAGTCDPAAPDCPAPPAAPAAPGDTPPCCASPECGTYFTAECSGGAWSLTGTLKTCSVCTPTAWVPTDCTATQQICAGTSCSTTDDCIAGAPDPFPAIPPCCEVPPTTTCANRWTAECVDGTWSINWFFTDCIEGCTEDWDCSGAPICEAWVCTADPCDPLDPPPFGCANPGPAPGTTPNGEAICGYCGCTYQAEYQCPGWVVTTAYPGVCAWADSDPAQAWTLTGGCGAQCTVSAPGPCV